MQYTSQQNISSQRLNFLTSAVGFLHVYHENVRCEVSGFIGVCAIVLLGGELVRTVGCLTHQDTLIYLSSYSVQKTDGKNRTRRGEQYDGSSIYQSFQVNIASLRFHSGFQEALVGNV